MTGSSHGFLMANKSTVIGMSLLTALVLAGFFLIPGFASLSNIRSMLLLAAFLGLASIGQTLVALLGGIDLSIPYVIGSANILLASLLNWGVAPPFACVLVIAFGLVVGALNGLLTFRMQGQSLILTLGTGFAVVGATQIVTSIGSEFAGNVLAQVPDWLRNFASIGGSTAGVPVSPTVLLWLLLGGSVVFAMSRTRFGRSFYAVGSNRVAAARLLISEFRIWLSAYAISGATAALTGVILLGFSGGGYVGVGDPYLFTTVAAVVIGGTSLLGGKGGYGATVIGTLILTILTSLLVGLGLSYALQQAVFGLLIVPMVALYARAPNIRNQI